jgi:hypothetical protein
MYRKALHPHARQSHCKAAQFGHILSPHLVRLVADESDDHAVEVEEEHEQVETEFDEGFLCSVSALSPGAILRWVSDLLVYVELPEDLGCIQKMLVLKDPTAVSIVPQINLFLVCAHTSLRSRPTTASSR